METLSDFTIDGTGLIIRPQSRVVWHKSLAAPGYHGVVLEIGKRICDTTPPVLVLFDGSGSSEWVSVNNLRRADDDERLPDGNILWSFL